MSEKSQVFVVPNFTGLVLIISKLGVASKEASDSLTAFFDRPEVKKLIEELVILYDQIEEKDNEKEI